MNPLAVLKLATSAAKIVKYVVEDNKTDIEVKELSLSIKALKKQVDSLTLKIEEFKNGAK